MQKIIAALALWLVVTTCAEVQDGILHLGGIPGEEWMGSGSTKLSCDSDHFSCTDGSRCIPTAWRCDGRPHCPDASDELNCTYNATCGAGQFRCARSGMCIAASWRCDGDADCGPHDASDEDPYMCEKDFKCWGKWARCATPEDGHFSCVPVYNFCDGVRHCLDGSDEWDICDNFTEAQCAPLGCKECRPTHEGVSCYCQPGYEPRNGTCVDSDECEWEGACAQRCKNLAGSFACACADGYTLNDDKRSCAAINDPVGAPLSLIVVTRNTVERVWPDPPATIPRNHSLTALNVRAIDFNYTNRSVCYIHHNISRAGIVCVEADDFGRRTVLPQPALFPDVDSVSHLAIDWVSNNWYFADEAREVVYVCDNTLQFCRMIIDSGLSKLRGFAIDPVAGVMFWTAWGSAAPVVGRAELGGGARAALAQLRLVYPAALALEPAARALYWADAYLECVERADYDGRHRRTVRRSYLTEKLQHISLLEDTLYLPVAGNRSISAVSRYSRERRHSTIALASKPTGVLVYHRQRQPKALHPCGSGNKGGCAHICVTAYRDGVAHAQCLCKHGYRLVGHGDCELVQEESYLVVSRGTPALVAGVSLRAADREPLAPATHAARPSDADVDVPAGMLYYCDVHRYEIVRQKLDGTGREVFIGDDVDNCEGIAVDWMGRNLYWTDDALGQISVARLDNSVRRVLIREQNFNPRSIALDPANGVMYWSVWASATAVRGRIEAAQMDGSQRRTLLHTDLHWPNGLALDFDTQYLYWCDTYLNTIERVRVTSGGSIAQGVSRELLLRDGPHTALSKPYGLAVYEGAVIWSEHGTGALRQLSANGTISTLRQFPPPLYGLALISASGRVGKNGCSHQNGGCPELCLAAGASAVRCECAAHCATTPHPPHCPPDRFHCGRGRCIDNGYVCDGDVDCPDGSDEDSSPSGPCANVTCADDSMRCDTNRCIPKSWVCDGLKDCADGSDESAGWCARAECGPRQWACALSRRCVPAAWRCDGSADCGPNDFSDEQGCKSVECSSVMFRCSGGGCVPYEYYCDGHADCADASDEAACRASPAPPAPLPPPRRRPQIHQNETNKHGLCEEHEFQCTDQECIRLEFRCDSRVDCLDGSDEAGCESLRPATSAAPPPAPAPAPACDAPALACDNNTRCVPLLQLCDGTTDCADGADEADRCGEPMCGVAACSHECHPSPLGAVCACPAPLRLAADGATCEPAHRCDDWGLCSQTCQPHKNRYKCTCYEGYRLADDGFTCKSTEKVTPLLVFSNRHEVRGVELPSFRSRALVSSLKNTIALDWRQEADGLVHLYWTDVVDDTIYRGTLTGEAVNNIEVVVQQGLSTAEGLAVDWIAGNLYWVESSLHQIEVARLDGQYRRTLITGELDSPRAIAADPRLGYLFWTDWEPTEPRIERASLAGLRRTRIVRIDAVTDGAWPNGLALDHLAQRLYWIDARSDSIHTVTYDGGDYREVLRGHSALSHPFAITVFESHVYWTDWRSNSVVRANKWNGTAVTVVQRTLTQPFDVKVIHPSRQPASATNPCGVNNGNCSHLCLIDSATDRVCACPHLMRLAADNNTCEAHETVVLVARGGEVRGLSLSAGAPLLAPTVAGPLLSAPHHLQALPSDHAVFWLDTDTYEVKRTDIRGGSVEAVVDSALIAAKVLALDWAARILYVAGGGTLVACGLHGEQTTMLLKNAPVNITTLASHPLKGKLYWSSTDGGFDHIETANGDGSGRRLLYKDAPHLSGVASMSVDIESDRLYWVNLASATIQYMDLKTEKVYTLPLHMGARPVALDVFEGELIWADNSDGTLRTCRKDDCSYPKIMRNNTDSVSSVRVYAGGAARAGGGACAARAAACAHLCVPLSDTRSDCRCAMGHRPHRHTCTPVDEALVYSLSWELRGLALAAGADRSALPPIPQVANAAAIDYHAEGSWIYWADPEAGAAYRVQRDGRNRSAVVRQGAGAGAQDALAALAVDWLAGNLYCADPSRNLLLVARLDGSHRYVLKDTDPLAVTALAVDPVAGWVFMSGGGWVQRARLDASEPALLYNGTALAGIALDTQADAVYWADTWDVSVWRAHYDGSGRRRLLAGAPLRYPTAIAVHRGHLYWLDTMLNHGSVVVAPLSNLTDHQILVDNVGDSLKDLFIWSKKSQTVEGLNGTAVGKTISPCAHNNGGCEALCLWDGKKARCACPHADLAADGKKCTPYTSFLMYARVTQIDSIHLQDENNLNSPYPVIENKTLMRNAIALAYEYDTSTLFYSDIQRGSINAVHFNGTNHRVLLEQAGAVEGLVFAADSGMLYWTCATVAAIRAARVAKLQAAAAGAPGATASAEGNSHVRTVLALQIGDRLRGIDYDPCEKRLYWSNWNQSRPSIERIHINGQQRQAIVTTEILMPNGLTLEHSRKLLYWADARLDKIESMRYDGSRRVVVSRSRAEHPFAVAAGGGWVFWTDWVARAVFRADAGGAPRALRRDVPRPCAIVLVAPHHQTCAKDPCAVDNGGCAETCSVDASGFATCGCGAGRKLLRDGRSCGEVTTRCPRNSFECLEGPCIPQHLVCDGVAHCSSSTDASDEDLYFCTSRECPEGTFACGVGGRCVPDSARCDGRPDCDDGNDEANCDCPPTHYKCDDGMCVEIMGRCDGIVQCADGSDEAACPRAECAADALRCASAPASAPACYPAAARCDGHYDCADRSDEADCQQTTMLSVLNSEEEPFEELPLLGCSAEQFECGGGEGAPGARGAVECIPLGWRCDGRVDCSDGSDETLHCGHTNGSVSCGAGTFRCAGGPCVAARARCDGVADCPRADDEDHCACPPAAFRCAAAPLCLHTNFYCDGDIDCEDGSDEPPGCSPHTFTTTTTTTSPTSSDIANVTNGTGRIGGSGLCGDELALECSGRCIPSAHVCDGRDHCQDGKGSGAGSDEEPLMCSSFAAVYGVGAGASAEAGAGACARAEWRCGNNACVPTSALCDGNNDCGDYTDEWGCKVNECLVMNGECPHNCTDLPVGAACWCRAGYRDLRPAHAHACADVDECAEDEPCDHICRNTLGSFVCSCAEGYHLMEDGVTCAVTSSIKASLIFTNRYYIRRTALTTDQTVGESVTSLLVHNLTNAVALDMLWSQGCLYWSDVTRLGSSIKRVCRGELHAPVPVGTTGSVTEEQQLIQGATLQNPDGLAVDWVGGNVYWCDKGTDTVEVSLLNGRHRRVLLRGDLTEPRALALLPSAGYLYWSDWGARAHIGRAGMDGSRRAVIISAGLGWPNALTLSPATNELYFADAREDYIAVADLDGNNVRVLFIRELMPWVRLHHVFALAVWQGRVYWSDWETKAIESCRRRPDMRYNSSLARAGESGGAYRCRTEAHTVHKPMDLRVLHPARQPPSPELSALCAQLNCTGLCLLTPGPPAEAGAPPSPASARCECPEHFVLDEDGRSCRPNCTSAQFICRNNLKCVPFWWRCDTQDDCGDGSDEPETCPEFRCSPGQFQCNNGRCVHPSHICDGEQNCGDGSDEIECDQFTCLSSQWKCGGNATAGISARCIPASARCDGRRDCRDGADELDCPPPTCPQLHFQCGDGSCIPTVWLCDQDGDCADESDEGVACETRQCARGEFRCRSGRCVPKDWLCDGEADCPDKEDEEQTECKACEPTYFRCGDSRCIPGRWRCDFEDDCHDGSDEKNCTPRNCSESEFRCDNGECIRGTLRCSGAAECPGGEDEAGCAAACGPRARLCADNKECLLDEWWCDGEVDCGDGSDEAHCDTEQTDGSGATESPLAGNSSVSCGARVWCGGGACLPRAWRCDGRRDCADGADETPRLCRHTVCPPNLRRCGDDTCIPPNLYCDGYNDCNDGSDENPQVCMRRIRIEGMEPPYTDDDNTNTSENERRCDWRTCAQLCLPRAHNRTCKCVPGYKQHQLPDGTLTCEATGEKARAIVSSAGVLRLRELHKHDHDAPPANDSNRAEIISIAVAPISGSWWVWWTDSSGRLQRLRLPSAQPALLAQPPQLAQPRKPGQTSHTSRPIIALPDSLPPMSKAETIIKEDGIIRGVAVDPISQRVYWTVVQPVGGEEEGWVRCARLDGSKPTTIWRRMNAELDDIVVHFDTGDIFWSERGTEVGVWRASGSGSEARVVARRRLRRPGALALAAPAGRLYVVDGYYGTLESLALSGDDRALHAVFAAPGTALPPHITRHENSSWVWAGGRACARVAVWEEWAWCASARGLVAVPRRGASAAPPPAARHRPAVSALALLHPAAFYTLNDVSDPCGAAACEASALCVRSGPAARACLCPDSTVPDNDTPDEHRRCKPEFTASGPPSKNSSVAGLCPLQCGPGACVVREGTALCACPAEFAGRSCQHYRCAALCHARGRCGPAAAERTYVGMDQMPPLQCSCYAGWSGARCEVPVEACARAACRHGAVCRRLHAAAAYCACLPGYTGEHCEKCSPGDAGATCRICLDYCYNNGTCPYQLGVSSCPCTPKFGGPCNSTAVTSQPPVPLGPANTTESTSCADQCSHGGRCMMVSSPGQGGVASACECVGGWGGPHCNHYVGYDHSCDAKTCVEPAFCTWIPNNNPSSVGSPYCVCPAGASCPELRGPGVEVGAGAWGAGLLALLALLAALMAALCVLHRRRRNAFGHARLADNVEINNPMYLAGEDELEQRNGGNHFANPVYESMYSPQQNNPVEEHATLLEGTATEAPPERTTLL